MKKQYALVVVLVLLVVGLTGISLIKYEHQAKGPSVAQLTSERNAALIDLSIAKQLDTVHEQAANKQVTDLKTQNATQAAQINTICTQVKAAKLIPNPCK